MNIKKKYTIVLIIAMDDEGNLRKDVAYVIGDGPDVVTVFKNGDVIPC